MKRSTQFLIALGAVLFTILAVMAQNYGGPQPTKVVGGETWYLSGVVSTNASNWLNGLYVGSPATNVMALGGGGGAGIASLNGAGTNNAFYDQNGVFWSGYNSGGNGLWYMMSNSAIMALIQPSGISFPLSAYPFYQPSNFSLTVLASNNAEGLTNIPLSGLSTNAAVSGQIVTYKDGTGWVPSNAPAGGSMSALALKLAISNIYSSYIFSTTNNDGSGTQGVTNFTGGSIDTGPFTTGAYWTNNSTYGVEIFIDPGFNSWDSFTINGNNVNSSGPFVLRPGKWFYGASDGQVSWAYWRVFPWW